MEKKTFELKINGEVIFEIEANGNKGIIDNFEKEVFGDYGLFYKIKDDMFKIFLNQMEIKMTQVFRDKKGKFIDPKKIIKSNIKLES